MHAKRNFCRIEIPMVNNAICRLQFKFPYEKWNNINPFPVREMDFFVENWHIVINFFKITEKPWIFLLADLISKFSIS